MRKEKIMAIQRRRMLTAALGGAFSASLLTAGRVDAAPAPVFEKPTADNPIIACYNENPLGLSAAARKAVQIRLRSPIDIPLCVAKCFARPVHS